VLKLLTNLKINDAGIITLVDAKYVQQHLNEVKEDGSINECIRQIALADRIVINKTDLISDESILSQLESSIRTVNAAAPLLKTSKAK
jgi:G3E family GTPase